MLRHDAAAVPPLSGSAAAVELEARTPRSGLAVAPEPERGVPPWSHSCQLTPPLPSPAPQAQLQQLSGELDGPSFRDIWRAVAVSVNRFMYNYIATEARFTPGGGC